MGTKLGLYDSDEVKQRIIAVDDTSKRVEIRDGSDTDIMDIEAHASRHVNGGDDEITGIAKSQLASNTIQWVEVIDLLNGELSVDASAAADTDSAFDIRLDAELLQSAKAAYLEVAYTWAATADGTIKLYDVTDAADISGTSISLTGGESSRRDRTADFLSNLTSGHDIRLRVTITATASETATIHAARLIIVCGAS